MSLSLKRRIARAALLVAAGAAPLAAAGAAQAAAPAKSPATMAGPSSSDSIPVGEVVHDTARNVATTGGQLGGKVVTQGAPMAGRAAGSLGKHAVPPVFNTQRLAGTTLFDTAQKLDETLPGGNLLDRDVSTDDLARDLTGSELPIG